MKYILLLSLSLLLLATRSDVKAQTAFNHTAYNSDGVTLDAESDTMTYTMSYSHSLVTVKYVAVKNAGTVAGTATLSYSVDGVDWTTAGTALTLTNVTRSTKTWELVTAARYFRIISAPTGTSTSVTTSAKLAVVN